jgi:hypothetical protein
VSKRPAPKTPSAAPRAKKKSLYVELTGAELAALDAAVAERQAASPDHKVTRAEIIRGWIRGFHGDPDDNYRGE